MNIYLKKVPGRSDKLESIPKVLILSLFQDNFKKANPIFLLIVNCIF